MIDHAARTEDRVRNYVHQLPMMDLGSTQAINAIANFVDGIVAERVRLHLQVVLAAKLFITGSAAETLLTSGAADPDCLRLAEALQRYDAAMRRQDADLAEPQP